MKLRSFLLFLCASAGSAWSQIVFEKELIKVTVAPDATELIAEFPFKVGSKGAEIINYDAPCSCLSARIEPLKEDRSARMKWEADMTGHVFGKFELGNFKGTVEKSIVLNLKDQPPVNLVVRVTIPELVAITPATQRWTQGGDATAKIYKIKIGGKEPIKITDTQGTNPNFPFELITKKEGREYEIHITPKDTASPTLGMVRIKTDSKFKRFKRLQMFAVVQAAR